MSENKVFVSCIFFFLSLIFIVLVACITIDDIIEKRIAISHGLCQTQNTGNSSWYWSTCPAKK